ncbi:MexW/MexI family multidrug efflux RND transporter permease subunit [Pseudomonas benzenivorans]|uniref:MexW/MexI family multidrug efflux RND transporter permease subunit n=1 Tax=Pseudomonas benzenivorans TaxID=556533 RepID=A0ABZ0PW68_9PSED|nr:MexW/MexI family multidrug efflux RND transporter permease subunit [Pseudomonas benzenivorans]WPC05433.1 MexW/MexI family multidrug efflux RND transporter permease subunit [Pseudomonas benzenivorans]
MTFTDLFVRRPVLALVVSLLTILLGWQAFMHLPVRQYPLLESASISVTTEYPGAPAELMQGFVTQPISQALSSVEGVDYLSASSSQGRSQITLRMALNQDSRTALGDVLAKVNQVKHRLPEQAYDPVIERSAGDATAVAYVGFSSETLSAAALTDYLSRVVQPLFAGIDGVAKVETFGGQRLALRVWLDAQRMAGHGVTPAMVEQALRANNFQAAPGQIKGAYVVSAVEVNSDLRSLDEFRDLVLRHSGHHLVRLGDVAEVELGAASYETSALMDGKRAVHLGLYATPGGNPLLIVAAIERLLPTIRTTLPPGVEVALAFETAGFIQASIDEVVKTLVEAILIVVAIIYLCLGSLRTVLIPVVSIPLSMLGALALMALCGFSLNLLTLLAMVLAIGLVVDDAIVVVENVHRHIRRGLTPLQAALIGAREIAAPVIAMTLTLAAVYAPIGLMGGLTGALFQEFALTLAGAVVVSGVIALTLAPVMSAALLPAVQAEGRVSRLAEQLFRRLALHYRRLLAGSLRYRGVVLLLALATLVSLPLLYGAAQRELAPGEDQGNLLAAIKSPQHASIDFVERYAAQLDDIFGELPETTSTWIINGTDGVAASFAGVNLSDWSRRTRDADAIQADLQRRVDAVEGNSIFIFQLPPLPASSGGLPVQMVIRTAQDYRALYQAMQGVKAAARQSGLFSMVDSDLAFNSPATQVRIDRSKANSLGIRMEDIGSALALLLGENYVNRFALDGRSYDVIPQAHRQQRLSPQALAGYYVATAAGEQVALSTLVSLHSSIQPNRLTQFDQQNSATLQAIPAAGVSLGQAVAFLEQQAAQLPDGFSIDWQAEARQFKQEGSALLLTFLFAVIVIYMVLAAQYESLVDPLIILITVPLSICGALLPLALGFATVNIYTQIGLVTLIGLISKHGILMVAFANELQEQRGHGRLRAILSAATIRLRPILMTTAAMVMGLVPLLFASGAGANSRFGLGLVIVFGMLVGTCFTLFVLPALYLSLSRRSGRAARLAELAAGEALRERRSAG